MKNCNAYDTDHVLTYCAKKTVGQTALEVLDDKGSLKQKAERKSDFPFTRYIDSNMALGKHAIPLCMCVRLTLTDY